MSDSTMQAWAQTRLGSRHYYTSDIFVYISIFGVFSFVHDKMFLAWKLCFKTLLTSPVQVECLVELSSQMKLWPKLWSLFPVLFAPDMKSITFSLDGGFIHSFFSDLVDFIEKTIVYKYTHIFCTKERVWYMLILSILISLRAHENVRPRTEAKLLQYQKDEKWYQDSSPQILHNIF